MTDFYKVIRNLSPDMTVAEIQKELLAQEGAWRRREITAPEKAQEMLVIINQAKKVFASPSSKAAYDRELENSRRKPVATNPQEERYQQYQKWYRAAAQYENNRQYYLAKTAIENALSYYDPDRVTPDFYCAACKIFRNNKEFQTAMTYINKAIVMSPETPIYYLEKALTYREWYQDPNDYSKNRESFTAEENKAANTALDLADRQNDRDALGKALGYIACLIYGDYWGKEAYYAQMAYRDDGSVYAVNPIPDGIKKAEKFAQEAVDYRDAWHNGDKILGRINSIYAAKRSNGKLAKQQWKEAQLREQQEAEEKKRAEEKAENERKAAAIKAKLEEQRETRKAILLIAVAALVIIVLVLISNHLEEQSGFLAGLGCALLRLVALLIGGYTAFSLLALVGATIWEFLKDLISKK